MEDWNAYNDLSKEELVFPVTISYDGFNGEACESNCELVFNGVIESLQKTFSAEPSVRFRNFSFRHAGNP